MRRRLVLSVLIALPILLLAAVTIVSVPKGSIAIMTGRGGGTPVPLKPGFAFRIPGLQTIRLYRDGLLRIDGRVDVASREGSAVTLPFRLEARPGAQRLLELARDGGRDGADGAATRLIETQIRAAAASSGTYDLASGVALVALAREAPKALETDLGPGLALSFSTPELSAELKAAFAPEAIFGRRVETGLWVLLVGLDSADWDLINPMIGRGELPNLARLKRQGAWARLRSNVPTLSPLLWTTVATGKAPDRHGINDFLVVDPQNGRQVPINSTFRKARALWNILSEGGLPVDFVAWWATWPAEQIDGHLISDRVAYSTFNVAVPDMSRDLVTPQRYAATVARLKVEPGAIPLDEVGRFLHISPDELRRARASAASGARPDERQESINVMLRVLASTKTYERIAIDLLEERRRNPRPARLIAVYFQGIDEVNHRFAHCAPPREALCSEPDFQRFHDAVGAFYRYQDRVLGDLLSRAPEATVFVMSDHGFASGTGRPKEIKPFIEGKPGLWHDLGGVFIASGPGIHPGEIPTVTLYDIAPTILHLLGLPTAEDMPGKVLEAALAPDFTARHPILKVPSYEPLLRSPAAGTPDAGRAPDATTDSATADPGEDAMVEQLRSLGYVAGSKQIEPSRQEGGGAVPTVLFHTNLATVYLGKKQYELAEAEYQTALRLDPAAPQPRLGLAAVYEAKREPEKALELLEGLEAKGLVGEAGPLVKMAELFIRIGRPADGIAFMQGLEPKRATGDKSEVSLRVAIGMLAMAAGRPGDADKSLTRALALDPTSISAMQELFALYDGQNRAVALEPLLRAALQREPRSAMHHNWLGLVLRRKGDLAASEAELRKALEVAPSLVGAMANLGSLYLQKGKPQEAVTLLREALSKDPSSVESRTNLIVALGMIHDLDGARRELTLGEADGARVPLYYNALAYALFLNGRNEEALTAVRESLKIDPRQPDALRLRAEIERGHPAQGSPYR